MALHPNSTSATTMRNNVRTVTMDKRSIYLSTNRTVTMVYEILKMTIPNIKNDNTSYQKENTKTQVNHSSY